MLQWGAMCGRIINNITLVTLFAVAAVASGDALAKGDVAAGQSKSGGCASCHGLTGMSPTDVWPNLAGQGYAYLVQQLKAFREGARENQVMQDIARALSDQEIEDFAAYFSAQKAEGPALPSLQTSPASSHAPIIRGPFVVPRPHPTREYWVDRLPPGEGHAVVVQRCNLCHDLQRTLAFARPREEWEDAVDAMTGRGLPLSPGEKPIIIDYLTRHFGPDSPPIRELGIKPCTRSEWPKGSNDFRSNWKGSYNIWLSNQYGGNIDIVDPVTRTIVRRIDCVSSPDRIEFSRDGNTAYVPDRAEHNITVIDTRTGAIKTKIPLIDRPNTAVLSRDYKKLYVGIWPLRADEGKRGYIQIVDTTTLRVVETIDTKGGIHYTALSSDGKLLLAMAPYSQFMNAYDTKSDKLLWTCCTLGPIGIMDIEAGPDGASSRIFVSMSGFYGMMVLDAKTGMELKRVPHPAVTDALHRDLSGPGGGFHVGEISPDGKTYWLISGSFIYRYALPSLRFLGEATLSLVDQAGSPYSPALDGSWLTISPDGQTIYAARPSRNLLSVIDAKSMKEVALIPTGEYPLHISIWPRGTR